MSVKQSCLCFDFIKDKIKSTQTVNSLNQQVFVSHQRLRQPPSSLSSHQMMPLPPSSTTKSNHSLKVPTFHSQHFSSHLFLIAANTDYSDGVISHLQEVRQWLMTLSGGEQKLQAIECFIHVTAADGKIWKRY